MNRKKIVFFPFHNFSFLFLFIINVNFSMTNSTCKYQIKIGKSSLLKFFFCKMIITLANHLSHYSTSLITEKNLLSIFTCPRKIKKPINQNIPCLDAKVFIITPECLLFIFVGLFHKII